MKELLLLYVEQEKIICKNDPKGQDRFNPKGQSRTNPKGKPGGPGSYLLLGPRLKTLRVHLILFLMVLL